MTIFRRFQNVLWKIRSKIATENKMRKIITKKQKLHHFYLPSCALQLASNALYCSLRVRCLFRLWTRREDMITKNLEHKINCKILHYSILITKQHANIKENGVAGLALRGVQTSTWLDSESWVELVAVELSLIVQVQFI